MRSWKLKILGLKREREEKAATVTKQKRSSGRSSRKCAEAQGAFLVQGASAAGCWCCMVLGAQPREELPGGSGFTCGLGQSMQAEGCGAGRGGRSK